MNVSNAERPQAGVTTDETRVVRMLSIAPAAYVSVKCEYAEVALPTAVLEQLSSDSVVHWRTEQERLALIAAGRARKLLAAAAQQQPLIAPLPAELTHIVVQLLENGVAYVQHGIDHVPIPELEIRYVGQRLGPTAGFGRIIVSERHVGLPLLSSDWWVA